MLQWCGPMIRQSARSLACDDANLQDDLVQRRLVAPWAIEPDQPSCRARPAWIRRVPRYTHGGCPCTGLVEALDMSQVPP